MQLEFNFDKTDKGMEDQVFIDNGMIQHSDGGWANFEENDIETI